MGISPLVFTGVSKYSADFQTILTRASSIANLPVKALENQQTDTVQQKLLATNLQDAVKSLGDSLTALSAIGDNQGVTGASSDTSKVSIVSTTANAPASYTVSEITSLATAASETSATGYADSTTAPVSTTGSLTLTVGGTAYPITLAAGKNNLVGLRDAINGLGAGITASVLTTGTGATPNYLSLSANSSGATTLKLTDDPTGAATNLITSNNQGSNAVFKLNGAPVSKPSNLVNDVVPGVSFNITGTTGAGQSAVITLSSDRTQLYSALQNVVTSYNTLSKQVDGQIGQSAGALTGDFLVREIQDSLRQLTGFQGTGATKSFADLGLELSNTGELSLNKATFSGLSDTQLSSAFAFVGTASTGLGSLNSKFTQLSDPISGLIQVQLNQYDATSTRLTDEIATLNDRNSQVQNSLEAKLQAADSLLAQLDSQQTVLTASLLSVNYTNFGKTV